MHIQFKRPLSPWIIIWIIFLPALFLAPACTEESPSAPQAGQSARRVIHQGKYTIPVFQSPGKQLNYALSRFSDFSEREAALRAVLKLFPNARMETGEARLELAYLSLGEDFRLAKRTECKQTLLKYEAIIKQFHDLPPICAKAQWYIAWIYMDLLKEKAKGIQNFKKVVLAYPNEGFLPSPRLRWQEIFARAARKETTFLSTKERWAAIALLEIARNADELDERIAAVKDLMTSYPSSRALGYGIMALLESNPTPDEIIHMAKKYMQSKDVYHPVAVYIKKRVEAATSKGQAEKTG